MSQSSGPVASFPNALTGYDGVGLLAEEVRSACPTPINRLQITALLESAGVTDAIAAQLYGYGDVFALADGVAGVLATAPAEAAPRSTPRASEISRQAMTLDYLRGPLGVLPLVLITVIVGVFQSFGRWEGARILTLSASTIGSLLVTGGFIQIAARKGSSYLSQGYALAAAHFVGRIGAISLATVLISGVLLWGVTRKLGWLAVEDGPLMLASYVALSCLWMLSAGLSIFKRVHWFGIALAAGVGVSWAVVLWLGEALGSQRATIALASGAGIAATLGVGAWAIRRAIASAVAASPAGRHRVRVAPLPQLVVGLAPYFGYGVVYIVGMLAGHLGGWVGRLPDGLARLDAIATSELGLTVALVAYILVGGVAEHTVQRFWAGVHGFQAESLARRPAMFAERLAGFQRDERHRFAGALAVSAGVVALFAGVSVLTSGRVLGIAWGRDLAVVLAAGLLGSALLAVAAFDCMMLITLSQPWPALLALACGAVVTGVVSVMLGVAVGYAWGALGMVIGNLVVLAIARVRLGRVIEHADYFYFTSF